MKILFDATQHRKTGRLILISFIGLFAACLMVPAEASAQRRKSVFDNKSDSDKEDNQKSAKTQPTPKPDIRRRNNNQNKKDNEEFAPTNVIMEVKGEGIELVATWFPPIIEDEKKKKRKSTRSQPGNPSSDEEDPEPGKSKVPFILVHDWTRSRADLFAMGQFLQAQGHAVLIPDLRGHGESVVMRGSTRPLDHTKFRKADKASAVADIDQCKRFLQEKNNEGILNIDLLNVVAVGDSAHLAIAWSITDWSWGPVAGIKQGKDVKSLILFSPSEKFAGSALKKWVKEPLISGRTGTPLPLLVIWGGGSDAAEDCDKFVTLLRKFRPEAAANADTATRWRTQDFFHFEAPTAMRGFEIAGNPNAREIWMFANNFVSQKVVAFKDRCPWQLRGADAVLKARAEEE